MKKTVFAVFCLAASISWADDGDETESSMADQVELYISVIENIDVTAEKAPAVTADEPDEDIDAILSEAEALEADESSE